MKRTLSPLLLAILLVTLLASAGPSAAAVPTLYGKINLTLHKFELERLDNGAPYDETDNWQVESNASRLGIKGDFAITDWLRVVYQAEYQVSLDGDDDRAFTPRNIYGGFEGRYGRLIGGKHDTPLKLIQGDVDRFNDLALADLNNIMVGENRQSNVIMYTTPTLAGLEAMLAVMPGEESINAAGEKVDNDGFADAISVSVSYSNDRVYLAVARDDEVDSYDATRLVADLRLGAVTVGVIYQRATNGSDAQQLNDVGDPIAQFGSDFDEQKAWLLSGEWRLDDHWSVKAQYGYSESTPLAAGWGDADATLQAIGVDYQLSKNAKLFAYYAALETEGDYAPARDSRLQDRTFAAGFELKF